MSEVVVIMSAENDVALDSVKGDGGSSENVISIEARDTNCVDEGLNKASCDINCSKMVAREDEMGAPVFNVVSPVRNADVGWASHVSDIVATMGGSVDNNVHQGEVQVNTPSKSSKASMKVTPGESEVKLPKRSSSMDMSDGSRNKLIGSLVSRIVINKDLHDKALDKMEAAELNRFDRKFKYESSRRGYEYAYDLYWCAEMSHERYRKEVERLSVAIEKDEKRLSDIKRFHGAVTEESCVDDNSSDNSKEGKGYSYASSFNPTLANVTRSNPYEKEAPKMKKVYTRYNQFSDLKDSDFDFPIEELDNVVGLDDISDIPCEVVDNNDVKPAAKKQAICKDPMLNVS